MLASTRIILGELLLRAGMCAIIRAEAEGLYWQYNEAEGLPQLANLSIDRQGCVGSTRESTRREHFTATTLDFLDRLNQPRETIPHPVLRSVLARKQTPCYYLGEAGEELQFRMRARTVHAHFT
jgi:hypothetical protein